MSSSPIYLLPFSKKHLYDKCYLSWFQDASTVRYLGIPSYLKGVSIENLEAYYNSLRQDVDYFFAVHCSKTDKFIGTVKLNHTDHHSKNIEIGMLLGDTSYRGKNLGTEIIRLGTEYAFEILGMHRIYALALEGNVASHKCFLSNGYKKEGVSRDYYWLEDHYESYIQYGLLEDEWKEIIKKR